MGYFLFKGDKDMTIKGWKKIGNDTWEHIKTGTNGWVWVQVTPMFKSSKYMCRISSNMWGDSQLKRSNLTKKEALKCAMDYMKTHPNG